MASFKSIISSAKSAKSAKSSSRSSSKSSGSDSARSSVSFDGKPMPKTHLRDPMEILHMGRMPQWMMNVSTLSQKFESTQH